MPNKQPTKKHKTSQPTPGPQLTPAEKWKKGIHLNNLEPKIDVKKLLTVGSNEVSLDEAVNKKITTYKEFLALYLIAKIDPPLQNNLEQKTDEQSTYKKNYFSWWQRIKKVENFDTLIRNLYVNRPKLFSSNPFSSRDISDYLPKELRDIKFSNWPNNEPISGQPYLFDYTIDLINFKKVSAKISQDGQFSCMLQGQQMADMVREYEQALQAGELGKECCDLIGRSFKTLNSLFTEKNSANFTQLTEIFHEQVGELQNFKHTKCLAYTIGFLSAMAGLMALVTLACLSTTPPGLMIWVGLGIISLADITTGLGAINALDEAHTAAGLLTNSKTYLNGLFSKLPTAPTVVSPAVEQISISA